ncbi:MAG: hypothetical protein ACE14V_07680 [bacterium]
MRVNRKKVYIGKTPKNEDGRSNLSPAENVAMIWELTAELWSLQKSPYVKQRLPRHITKLIKP